MKIGEINMTMFEQFTKKYKNNVKEAKGDKAAYEKNDVVEITLLIIMIIVLITSFILLGVFNNSMWIVASICWIVLFIFIGTIELYRSKIKYKKFTEEHMNEYKKRFITPLIKTLNEFSFSDEKGVEWAIYHCKSYKDHCGITRIGYFFKNLSIVVLLPIVGFAAGALSSLNNDLMLTNLVDLALFFALLIIGMGMLIFMWSDPRHKSYLDLESNLRYIQTQPDLMKELEHETK